MSAGPQGSDRRGFLTSAAPYIDVVDSDNDWVKALITSGDLLSSGYHFGKIPDGIGAVSHGAGKLDVFVNHETSNGSNHDGWARVSHLTIDADTGAVRAGEYYIDGTEGYQRFCSASTFEGSGFVRPYFFTGEEVDDGVVVAVDARSGISKELPWLGLFSHENAIQVPYFWTNGERVVALGFEDGPATQSEVYLYVADSGADLLNGDGQLYVLAADDASSYARWDDIYFATGAIGAHFVPLDWDWTTQGAADLHADAMAKGAFRFIRPEDGAFDKREGMGRVVYFADTGNDRDASGNLIAAGSNGQSWLNGRIYKLVFGDGPTVASLQVIVDGNDPDAPGYGLMINPDNLDTSQSSLMIQEDRIGPNRPALTTPYDITKNAKILRYDLEDGSLEIVAYVNQVASPTARHGDWESSGILDASETFGEGTWLVDVQAHAFNEGGQLLLLHVDES